MTSWFKVCIELAEGFFIVCLIARVLRQDMQIRHLYKRTQKLWDWYDEGEYEGADTLRIIVPPGAPKGMQFEGEKLQEQIRRQQEIDKKAGSKRTIDTPLD
jgi:hypothetical protein